MSCAFLQCLSGLVCCGERTGNGTLRADTTRRIDERAQGMTTGASGYSGDDLKLLRQVFQEALTEMMEKRVDIPTSVMARRIFDAARFGERDRIRLRSAALGQFADEIS
jgi:hypothetical protein